MIETFLGLSKSFKGICTIYPPKVRDMVDEKTKSIVNLLTFSQEELEDYFVDKTDQNGQPIKPPTPFEYIMINALYNKEFEKQVMNSFQLFLHEPVTLHYKIMTIIIGDLEKEVDKVKNNKQAKENLIENFRTINADNFFEFQNELRAAMGEAKIDPPNENENEKIKRMKALARYRDRVKAKKGLGITFEETLVSICCMGIGLTPLNIGEISYAAAKQLVEKYQQKEKYQIDIDSLLAGADSKKIKPKYWMNKDN